MTWFTHSGNDRRTLKKGEPFNTNFNIKVTFNHIPNKDIYIYKLFLNKHTHIQIPAESGKRSHRNVSKKRKEKYTRGDIVKDY